LGNADAMRAAVRLASTIQSLSYAILAGLRSGIKSEMYNFLEIDATTFVKTQDERRQFVDSRGWAAIGGIRVTNSQGLTREERDELSRFFWFEIEKEVIFR
jgi:hypothetical protein